eukprot:gene54902-50229_t
MLGRWPAGGGGVPPGARGGRLLGRWQAQGERRRPGSITQSKEPATAAQGEVEDVRVTVDAGPDGGARVTVENGAAPAARTVLSGQVRDDGCISGQ